MKIDLFTLIAQIINFLILVFLLYYFLFKRLIKVMDEREKRIENNITESKQKKEEAEKIQIDYQKKLKSIESSQRELQEKTLQEIEKQKQELLKKAHEEIEQSKTKWEETLTREREAFAENLRKKIIKTMFDLSSKALNDLANKPLEEVIMLHFLEKLKEQKKEIKDKQDITIETAFAIDDKRKKEIADRINELTEIKSTYHFKQSPEMGCGINLQFDDSIIKWNLANYLADLEKDVNQRFITFER